MSGPWLYDRVRDTSVTIGTGTLTLANSAPSGFRTFGSVLSSGDTVYYTIQDTSGANWETGIGTYTSSGTTLARNTVLASSNSGSLVNFTSGALTVFCGPLATLMGDRLPEISVTGATTATLDRQHVCSGTSADYTLTLPAPQVGRWVWVRLDQIAAMSKRVTLDAGSGKTIGHLGQSQVMWAGEELALKGVSSTAWSVEGGVCRPMQGEMKVGTAQQIVSASTFTKITGLDASVADPTGAMVDTANKRLYCRRSGDYTLTLNAYLAGSSNGAAGVTANIVNVLFNAAKNADDGSGRLISPAYGGSALSGCYALPNAGGRVTLAAGDYLVLVAYISLANQYVTAAGGGLSLVEVPPW